MRAGDRLDLVELHPEDARDLTATFARERRVNVHASDGYLALKAFLPPRERRGLVLIDPPYEASDEFTRLVRGLKQGYRRWRTGVFAIWYPIKHRAPVAAFHAALVASGIRRITIAELLLRPDDDPERLNGCGLVLVNLPWRLDTTLSELLPALSARFGASPSGGALVKTLVPE
jgi:23S rRNA (adenine2030-N6)-methyltransferase